MAIIYKKLKYPPEIESGAVRTDYINKISDEELIKLITAILEENDIKVLSNNISIQKYKALPDNIDAFREMFIVTKNDEPAFINESTRSTQS